MTCLASLQQRQNPVATATVKFKLTPRTDGTGYGQKDGNAPPATCLHHHQLTFKTFFSHSSAPRRPISSDDDGQRTGSTCETVFIGVFSRSCCFLVIRPQANGPASVSAALSIRDYKNGGQLIRMRTFLSFLFFELFD